MLKFQNLSIRHKLTAIIVLTSGLMILISSLVLIVNEATAFRRNAIHNISVLTEVVAINSTAALSFQDPQTANELLQSLKAEPHIIAAAIYNAAGDRFALSHYGNKKAKQLPKHIELANILPEKQKRYGFLSTICNKQGFDSSCIDFWRPVILKNKTIGMVYVMAEQGWRFDRMNLFVSMVFCIMLGLIILSYFLSQRLQRVVSIPIERLAKTMELVTQHNNYTVRVHPKSSDELGKLMIGFNDMLERIQKRDLELERVSRMKSEFLANMSHELRTPLNAIIGFSDLMIEHHFGELNETQDEYIKDIHDSGLHLLSLINEILDISRVESGKMTVNLGDVDIANLMTSSLTMIREKAIKHNIGISIQIDDEMPRILRVDERKLKQVLYNLLSNAAKFTQDGGRIKLSAEIVSRSWVETRVPEVFKEESLSLLEDSGESFCRISVSDTGIGIKHEDIKKIFTAFEQVESSISRKYGGTGLGLALCKNFVEMHHGFIWAESVMGQGSTFTLVLPYVPEDQ